MIKALIKTLNEWQRESLDRPAGLKEPAAYQRVIDECVRMMSNQEIKERIEESDGTYI